MKAIFKRCNRWVGLLSLMCLMVTFNANAQNIYYYSSATNGAAATIAANATGTALTRVNGAAAPGSPCGSGFSSTSFSSTTVYAPTLQAVSVTARPTTGYKLRVESFSVGIRRSGTGPAFVRLAYSLNNGATWIDKGSNDAANNAGCGSMATAIWNPADFDVTSVTDGIIFRVYAFGASGGTGTFQIMNLNIVGSVMLDGPPPTITPVVSAGMPFCVNGVNDLPLSVQYSSAGTFSSGNTFTIQMADASGSFASPTALGNLSANTSTGLINGVIPGVTPIGIRKLRIVSSSPALVGDTINIVLNSALSIAGVVSQPLCYNTGGSVSVTATTGTPPLTHKWSNGFTTDVISDIAAGTYTDTVTDIIGCKDTQSFVINQPPPPIVSSVLSLTNILCTGNNSGEGEISAIGGTGLYSYIWTNSNGDTVSKNSDLVQAYADTYAVYIIDANLCMHDTIVVISQPDRALSIEIDSVHNASCFYCTNGYISALINGGTEPYTYMWNNGLSNISINSLLPARYCLQVLDANGCYEELCGDVLSNTAVGKNNTETSCKVYPNPASSLLHVSIKGMVCDEQSTLEIFDASGKVILQTQYVKQDEVYTINVTDWNTGMYYYRITTCNQSIYGNLSIQ